MKAFKNIVIGVIPLTILFINTVACAQSEWKAPESADALFSPYKGNATAILEGKKLYDQMCAVCHGNKAKGDGVAGMNLKPRPTNLTKANGQADGAIYWKITEGRPPMATYKDVLKDEQRWQLVSYIRSLQQ